jgi:TATA-box binding protein (TBP) (component of TFIID and TFIIIB)
MTSARAKSDGESKDDGAPSVQKEGASPLGPSAQAAREFVQVPDKVLAAADATLRQTLTRTYVTNVVCTAYLGATCPIKLLAWLFCGNFVRNRFPSVIGNSMDGAWTVFERGYLRSAGADRREKAQLIIYQLMFRMYLELGLPFGIYDFSVHNIVLATHLPYHVNLAKLHSLDNAYYAYEPERFPGVIVRPVDQKLAISLFSSGKWAQTALGLVFSHFSFQVEHCRCGTCG